MFDSGKRTEYALLFCLNWQLTTGPADDTLSSSVGSFLYSTALSGQKPAWTNKLVKNKFDLSGQLTCWDRSNFLKTSYSAKKFVSWSKTCTNLLYGWLNTRVFDQVFDQVFDWIESWNVGLTCHLLSVMMMCIRPR